MIRRALTWPSILREYNWSTLQGAPLSSYFRPLKNGDFLFIIYKDLAWNLLIGKERDSAKVVFQGELEGCFSQSCFYEN